VGKVEDHQVLGRADRVRVLGMLYPLQREMWRDLEVVLRHEVVAVYCGADGLEVALPYLRLVGQEEASRLCQGVAACQALHHHAEAPLTFLRGFLSSLVVSRLFVVVGVVVLEVGEVQNPILTNTVLHQQEKAPPHLTQEDKQRPAQASRQTTAEDDIMEVVQQPHTQRELIHH
jgi:hypothetical protein